MGVTTITWEEFEKYQEISTPDNLYIREHEGKYYTVFELGVASVRRIFEITAVDFDSYLSGERSADEVLFKAQNDRWPPTEEERRLADKKFLESTPTALIADPTSWELFTKEELEELIPMAEKEWLAWKGKLPDNYVSPLDE